MLIAVVFFVSSIVLGTYFFLSVSAIELRLTELERMEPRGSGIERRLSELEKPVSSFPWGAILVGHSPQGEMVIRSMTSMSTSNDSVDVRELAIPEDMRAGAMLFVWGSVMLAMARVGEVMLRSDRAPLYMFEEKLRANQTLVFGVTPLASSGSLPRCILDRRQLRPN